MTATSTEIFVVFIKVWFQDVKKSVKIQNHECKLSCLIFNRILEHRIKCFINIICRISVVNLDFAYEWQLDY